MATATKSRAKKKKPTASRAKGSSPKAVAKPQATSKTARAATKKTPQGLDDHTLLTQVLVFLFAMLSIIFAAMAYYSYA